MTALRHSTPHCSAVALKLSPKIMKQRFLQMAPEMLGSLREDRRGSHSEGRNVTKNTKALMNALRQSINEAIIESNDVAAVVAALKRTGQRPAFAIAVSLQDATEPEPCRRC